MGGCYFQLLNKKKKYGIDGILVPNKQLILFSFLGASRPYLLWTI